ncbi:glycosyltransferase family 4 protein [Granulosicoccus sp.]|nr:glycosyltransferase family 4 protein [Granulosicoccus sp.]
MVKKKNTILVLSEVFPPTIGGSGNWLHEIYKRQPTEKTVLLVGDHPDAAEFDSKSELNVVRTNMITPKWSVMKLSGTIIFFKMLREIIRLGRTHKLSEIHCGRPMPEGVVGLVASKILRTGLVVFIHGEDIEISRRSREHRFFTQLVLARADRLVCNCKHSRSLLVDAWRCKDANVRVLFPRTDTALFTPVADRNSAKEGLGWNGRKVLLTVSRLDYRKGHDKLIEALPRIIVDVPKVLYVIAGGGLDAAYGKQLQQQVHDLGLNNHVVFTGACEIDMLVRYYQCCDLFVLPNRQIGGNLEGFGIVLLEAQACGRPVIAGDSGGTVETMLPGESGLIVDCTEAENLVAPVVDLIKDTDRLEKMGKRGRQSMVENFSWSTLGSGAAASVFLEKSPT